MLSSYYRPINECFIPQYHYVAYENGLGPSRLVHDAEIATKRGVLHEGAPLSLSSPRLPYHAIIVLSTAYQWMAGAMYCVYDIRGWLGAANAGAWCHNGHDTTVNHTMIIWRCNFLDRDPSMMVHTIDTNGLLPTNEDHSPLPIHVRNKVYMIWRWICGIDSTLRPK